MVSDPAPHPQRGIDIDMERVFSTLIYVYTKM